MSTGLGNRVTTTTQAGFGGNKKKQFSALRRAAKQVTGVGQLKNTGLLGK